MAERVHTTTHAAYSSTQFVLRCPAVVPTALDRNPQLVVQMYPPINVADETVQQSTAAVHPAAPKFEVRTAEESELASLAHSTASISRNIRRVEHALEVFMRGCS